MDEENPAFIRKTLRSIESVVTPKIIGLDNLIKYLEHEPLQFLVLFSSVSGIVPSLGVGQSDYAMANAYMDYAAEALVHTQPIVSIQWPNWKESGFGETKSKTYEKTGLLSHTNVEGLRCWTGF